MADLVTHLCSALLPGALIGAPRATWLALGAVLPDIAARVPGLAFDLLRQLGVPIPFGLDIPLGVLHMPVGILSGGVLLAQLIHPSQRHQAARWLVAGGGLHLAVDLLQDHHGHGYFVAFPISTLRFELGCMGSEATVAYAPYLALITALVWALRWAVVRRAGEAAGPPPER